MISMRSAFLSTATAAALALPGMAWAATYASLDGSAPVVIAHRGASGYLPGHSLASYELAAEMGADYIETDLHLTSDGVLVAMHDEDMARTTNVEELYGARNGGYLVSDFTLAEIKTLTVEPTGTASTSYPGFTPSSGTPFSVPTLQDIIDLTTAESAAKGRQIGIYAELKENDEAAEDALLTSLIANDLTRGDAVVVQSFHAASLARFAAKQAAADVDVEIALLGIPAYADFGAGAQWLVGLADYTALTFEQAALFADILSLRIDDPLPDNPLTQDLTEAMIAAAHLAGLPVHGWTFSEDDPLLAATEYDYYTAGGIDGIITDYPDLALTAVYPAAEVPLPATLPALFGGLALLAGLRRRT